MIFSQFWFCQIENNGKFLNSGNSFFKVRFTFLIFFDDLSCLQKPPIQLSVLRHFSPTKFLKMDETINEPLDVVQIVFLQQNVFQQMPTPLFIDFRRFQNVGDEGENLDDDFWIDVDVVVEMSQQNVVSFESIERLDVGVVAAGQGGEREDQPSDQLVAFAGPEKKLKKKL